MASSECVKRLVSRGMTASEATKMCDMMEGGMTMMEAKEKMMKDSRGN